MKPHACLLLSLLLMACGQRGNTAPDTAPETPTAVPDASSSKTSATAEMPPATLQSIPLPDLSQSEPAVAEQIRERHGEFQELLAQHTGQIGDNPEVDRRLAAAHGDLGRLLHAYKLTSLAARCYENALLLEPEAFEWPYYLGALAQEAGNPQVAIQHFEKALTLRPEDAAAQLHLAQVLLEQNQLEAANTYFAAALDTPGAAYAHLGRGRVAALRGNHQKAIDHFKAALERQPIANSVHYDLAQSHRQLGNLEAAASHLERFGGVAVTFPDPLLKELDRQRTGLVAQLRIAGQAILDGRYEDSLAAYEKALEIAPDDTETRTVYGLVLAQRDLEAGLKEMQEALRQAPEDAGIHLSYGQLLLEKQRPQEALEPLKSAVLLAPDLPEARLQLAAAHQSLGQLEPALGHYKAFLERIPDNLPVWLEQARLNLELGRLQDAQNDLERVLELDPQNLTARVTLAEVLGRQSDHQAAAFHLAKVIETNPQDRAARLAEAEYLLKAQDPTAALKRLEESHILFPQDPELSHSLARLLAVHPNPSHRDPTRALRLVEQAFEQLRSPYYAETMAMALAAGGRHQEATAWQEAILAEAAQSQDQELVSRLRTNLNRYRQGQAATNPWSKVPQDPP